MIDPKQTLVNVIVDNLKKQGFSVILTIGFSVMQWIEISEMKKELKISKNQVTEYYQTFGKKLIEIQEKSIYQIDRNSTQIERNNYLMKKILEEK